MSAERMAAKLLQEFQRLLRGLYIAHLYALHAIAIMRALARGFPSSSFDFATQIGGIPHGFGFPLWVTIPFALATVGGLYPAARWSQRVRQTKRYPVTRYL